MSTFKELVNTFDEIIMPASIKKRNPCYGCKGNLKTRKVKHVNIMQDPSEKLFCTEDCKLNWIGSQNQS